jgi:hypothetical protein
MNNKLIGRPLLAVIETSDARAALGQNPVMTIIKPMNKILAWLYRWLCKTKKIDADYLHESAQRLQATEYVVELDSNAFVTLTGQQIESKYCRMVLSPAIAIRAKLSKLIDSAGNSNDVRP